MIIKIIKLCNGDDIIGYIKDESDTSIRVSHAQKMVISQNNEGESGIVLIPWCPGIKDDNKGVEINNSAIVTTYEPEDELKNAYSSRYGSITTPPTDLKFPGV